MEIQQIFELVNTRLSTLNEEIKFSPIKENGVKADQISIFEDGDIRYMRYTGARGSYKILLNTATDILTLECSADSTADAEYKEITKILFEAATATDRSIRSLVNELTDELTPLYKEQKKDLAAVKLPKSVSKAKVKNGIISYTEVDLVTRFTDQYPELKDRAKEMMLQYDELLPETFFVEYGTPLVLEILRSKDDQRLKKLFKLLNEVYENGTNAAQDTIAVTILGEMKNDPSLLETADQYMDDYMSGPVHEVNKIITSKSVQKKLKNPPAYKPKKKKNNVMTTLMNGGQPPQQ